ncbi:MULTISPECIES: DNA primase small subunit PriS [Haloarcula]|uniref:DNA primase small subunit PriS n=2 Tax=Haloarcula marismortui (strain ATCC 43049 / DSM 3752 / JCM 8966 / VKM B-1809) TaxID=272569 RepID=PRIS_HALMA|nr:MULTISPECIES: DNA primase small subunit PriS [Haloarcula]Q5V554.1 RecName: Full=DNA primase small subunit PriS [Haloarcula marismortui ATCC 43049]AAV45348.1 eukaryotic-type DNA primase small subunit [Haloarcula marismortui ATCC 43049]NHX38796.1 DNA primase small subunit PriS [Haloarcula sp. R1-2]QCP93125.1 DNA primase small subunit PriS [Haloarcula marismortui ATCC 43049]
MEERTRAYLRGRFGDHYRQASVTPPPAANEREWGFIPWTEGPGETMVRHRSLLDLGEIEDFLGRRKPRHVYFSAGRYDEPSASTMSDKGWRSSDLVFDLDADHLPSVVLGEDSYAEMLAKCKDALRRLLDFLEDDFGFDDLTIVFSGGRGYHVHVRDERIRHLERDARREVVDYVRGIGLEFDELVDEESVAGTAGRSSPAQKRTLSTEGGWSARAHRHMLAVVDDLLAMEEADALEQLQEYDGIGEGKATAALNAARSNYEQLEAGNIDVHPAFYQLAKILLHEVVAADNAPIDEPVTTDTNRLIRLPGSLHGGSGLEVQRIDRDDLDAFDPLVDPVPETFRGHDITVEVTDGGLVELDGDSFTLEAGNQTVPEHVGVFLMARGRAEKGKE